MCKNKHCYKLSFIVDQNGIPINSVLSNGSISDSLIGQNQIESLKMPIKNATILADKGYDSKNFREICKKQFKHNN